MKYVALTNQEMANTYVGEAITLGAIMAVIAIAVMAVVVYKLYMSNKGNVNVPGGFKFTWN